MNTKIDFKNVILCEYVARGEGNKHILINAYSGDIIVDIMPASIVLALYIEYISKTSDALEVNLAISLNGKLIANVVAKMTNLTDNQPGVIAIPMFHLQVEAASTFDVTAAVGTEPSAVLLNKRILTASENLNHRPTV